MKVNYIKEGYIKTVDKLKSTVDKKTSAEDIRKYAREMMIPSIRQELYRSLYIHFAGNETKTYEDKICKNYNIRKGFDESADISFRVPSLIEGLVRLDLQEQEDEKSWNNRLDSWTSEPDLASGKVLCSPIKDIYFSGSECIAVIRLINFNTNTTVELFPCEFLKQFDAVEKEMSEKFNVPFTIKLVVLKEESNYFQDYRFFLRKSFAETEFPGATIRHINLYNFDKESFKDLEKFINRFSDFKKVYLSRLDLSNINIDSLSDIPDLGVKFNFIAFNSYAAGDSVSGWNSVLIPNKIHSSEGFEKFLKPRELNNNLRPNILIFPNSLTPADVVKLSDGAITEEEYNRRSEFKEVVSFNPYNGVNTTKYIPK